MAERSEARKREAKLRLKISFIFIFDAKLRFAQPFLAKFKWTTNWSFSPQGLNSKLSVPG